MIQHNKLQTRCSQITSTVYNPHEYKLHIISNDIIKVLKREDVTYEDFKKIYDEVVTELY